MPPPSAALYGLDTIAEFERAAQQRFDEGVSLASAGFYGGAIYLHGYVAEMLLKAAGYKHFGLGVTDPIEDQPLSWRNGSRNTYSPARRNHGRTTWTLGPAG